MEEKVLKDEVRLEETLTQNQYYVTEAEGTEPPFHRRIPRTRRRRKL